MTTSRRNFCFTPTDQARLSRLSQTTGFNATDVIRSALIVLDHLTENDFTLRKVITRSGVVFEMIDGDGMVIAVGEAS